MTPDAHAFLQSLAPSTMKFGLERMRAAGAALGEPWRAYRTLHVAGTNGKGSTCAFAEAILRAAGVRVGLYTSPHLEAVNERIRVDGRDISDAQLARGIDAVNRAYQGDGLTYFEFLTALALWHFREEGVEVGVIEVGLGGRFDATNVIAPTACAIATIGFDHTEYLGDTLAKIAFEKAGILKRGVPAAVLTRDPEALAEIERVAREVNAPLVRDFELVDGVLRIGDRKIERTALALAGAHQRQNAALASQAALLVEPTLSDEIIRRGLASARWPGRLEMLNGVLLDGAHNLEGARALAAHLDGLRRPVHLVFGVLADKDVAGMIEALAGKVSSAHVVAPDSPRALSAAECAPLFGGRAPATPHPDLPSALSAARRAAGADGQVVLAGSLYLVGPARKLLCNELGAARRAL